jgi:hypothetical protein
MASLQIDPNPPQLTPTEHLAGWRREFCAELLGDGAARIFVRAVEQGSLKAAELLRATLFHRLDTRFSDLAGCVDTLQSDLGRLADSARRPLPEAQNLFVAVEYDHATWARVQDGLDRWARR